MTVPTPRRNGQERAARFTSPHNGLLANFGQKATLKMICVYQTCLLIKRGLHTRLFLIFNFAFFLFFNFFPSKSQNRADSARREIQMDQRRAILLLLFSKTQKSKWTGIVRRQSGRLGGIHRTAPSKTSGRCMRPRKLTYRQIFSHDSQAPRADFFTR